MESSRDRNVDHIEIKCDSVWKLPRTGTIKDVLWRMENLIPSIVKRVEEREDRTYMDWAIYWRRKHD